MGPFVKKPFKGRSYYFDLRYYRNQDELIKIVKKLGAKVESFLSKEVTHVVTDRPLKSKPEGQTPATSKTIISTFSPINDSGYVDMGYHASHGSPFAEAHTPVLSRGQALLQKAKQKNKGSTDLLSFCEQWHIKVTCLQKLLDFIYRCKAWSKHARENKAPKEKTSSKLKHFQEVLKSPFIKVEDSNCKFKPFYKVYQSWNDCFSPTFLRVVKRMQKKVAESNSLILKPSQIPNVMNNVSNSNLINAKTGLNANTLSHNYVSNAVDSKKYNAVKDKYKKNAHAGKKVTARKSFCEICSIPYLNMKEHLSSVKHKYFMNNSQNFKAIERVNLSLPTVEDFLKKASLLVNSSATITKEISHDDSEKKLTNISNNLFGDPTCEKDGCLPGVDGNDIIYGSCSTEEYTFAFPFLRSMPQCSDASEDLEYLSYKKSCKLPLDIFNHVTRCMSSSNIENTTFPPPLLAVNKPSTMTAAMKPAGLYVSDSLFCLENLEEPASLNKDLQTGTGLYSFDSLKNIPLGSMYGRINDNIAIERINTFVSQRYKKGDMPLSKYNYHSEDQTESFNYASYGGGHSNRRFRSSSEPDSINEVLNINGCLIRKYPFRNFGYGAAAASSINFRSSSPVKAPPLGDIKSILDFRMENICGSEHENQTCFS